MALEIIAVRHFLSEKQLTKNHFASIFDQQNRASNDTDEIATDLSKLLSDWLTGVINVKRRAAADCFHSPSTRISQLTEVI